MTQGNSDDGHRSSSEYSGVIETAETAAIGVSVTPKEAEFITSSARRTQRDRQHRRQVQAAAAKENEKDDGHEGESQGHEGESQGHAQDDGHVGESRGHAQDQGHANIAEWGAYWRDGLGNSDDEDRAGQEEEFMASIPSDYREMLSLSGSSAKEDRQRRRERGTEE